MTVVPVCVSCRRKRGRVFYRREWFCELCITSRVLNQRAFDLAGRRRSPWDEAS